MELISFEPCQKLPPHLPEGLSAVRCKVKSPSGILFDVILGGPQKGKASHDCLASGAKNCANFYTLCIYLRRQMQKNLHCIMLPSAVAF